MVAIATLTCCLVVISIASAVVAVQCDKAEAELKIAQAELAKYRKQRDSRGRFTK